MSQHASVIAKFENHPKYLGKRINALALDLNKVSYAQSINDLDSARTVSMPCIWDCLLEGEVSLRGVSHLGDEIRGTIANHSPEGLVLLEFSLDPDDKWIEVLSAKIEVK